MATAGGAASSKTSDPLVPSTRTIASRLHRQVRCLRRRLRDRCRGRDVLEVDACPVQRAVAEQRLDGIQGDAHLHGRKPCGWTRFSIPAFAASRLQSVRT